MTRRTRTATAALVCLSMLVAACGDDDDETGTTDSDDTSAETTGDGEQSGSEGTSLDLTLTDDGLEGLPDTFAGGAVEVTFTVEATDRDDVALDFSQVDDGTTAEQFAEEFIVVFDGGPFPEFVRNNAGVEAAGGETATSTILLEPGTHVVWYETDPGEDDETPPEIMGTVVEVTEGASDLPETDNEIVARDYGFEPNVTGPGSVTFRNEGPEQLHHAVVVDFGTNPLEVVEEAIEPLLNSGPDAPPPDIEGLDIEQVDFEFAGSSVFGPGLGGTFEADFTSGNTYALVCFISDRAGGPPHAIGHQMYEAFTVP